MAGLGKTGPEPHPATNQVFLSQPSSASGHGRQARGASPSLLKAPVRLRLHSMTIKTDRAVCLILPKSLVCIQEPTQDFSLIGGVWERSRNPWSELK